jgi:hypothetical protein
MAEEVTPKRKPGRPMKKAESAPFVGFTKELIQDTYFRMPAIWIDVCAEIDNLAELKVVQYVLRHTWGYQDYEGMKHITIDEFVNGRKRRDGSRIDSGTGLSESAVREGIERAIKHGFLLCAIDDSDKARIKKYYALHMQEETCEDCPEEDYADNLEVFDNCAEVVINYPDTNYKLPRSSKNKPIEQTRGKRIRIVPPLNKNNEEGREDCPEEKYIPQFIKEKIEGLSRTLGDHEHIGSNIVQAYNLFQQSGMTPDTFANALYEAKDKAQKRNNIEKKNSKGRINRMPYFFMCLRQNVVKVSK